MESVPPQYRDDDRADLRTQLAAADWAAAAPWHSAARKPHWAIWLGAAFAGGLIWLLGVIPPGSGWYWIPLALIWAQLGLQFWLDRRGGRPSPRGMGPAGVRWVNWVLGVFLLCFLLLLFFLNYLDTPAWILGASAFLALLGVGYGQRWAMERAVGRLRARAA